jgi:hypothetical protein
MRSIPDLDLEADTRFTERIRDLCDLFITIVNDEVFLIHQTAREFLVRVEAYTGHESVWKRSFSVEESEIIIAKCCILYLRFAEFERDPLFFKSREAYKEYGRVEREYRTTFLSALNKVPGLRVVPFYGYSTYYWEDHFLHNEALDEDAVAFAVDLCDPKSRCFTLWISFRFSGKDLHDDPSVGGHLTFSRLMIAVRLRWAWLVCKLLEDDTNEANYSDIYGNTALTLAAG